MNNLNKKTDTQCLVMTEPANIVVWHLVMDGVMHDPRYGNYIDILNNGSFHNRIRQCLRDNECLLIQEIKSYINSTDSSDIAKQLYNYVLNMCSMKAPKLQQFLESTNRKPSLLYECDKCWQGQLQQFLESANRNPSFICDECCNEPSDTHVPCITIPIDDKSNVSLYIEYSETLKGLGGKVTLEVIVYLNITPQ